MSKYPALNLSTIKSIDFPKEQFYPEETAKSQICLHHTASGRGTDGDWRSWISNPERVATCVIIDHNGQINQLYNSKFWGHHLGVQQSVFDEHGIKESNNRKLNQTCIGIEIDSWGPLVFHDGEYRSYTGTKVAKEEVVVYEQPFKTLPGKGTYFEKIGAAGEACHMYQRYSDEQIISVAQLLELWGNGYNIPLTYNESMWDVSLDALRGKAGIWTHVSYRSDKNDCVPQLELIQMLKSLT